MNDIRERTGGIYMAEYVYMGHGLGMLSLTSQMSICLQRAISEEPL